MNNNKMSTNKDKVVIVTEGSTGIGHEISASGDQCIWGIRVIPFPQYLLKKDLVYR